MIANFDGCLAQLRGETISAAAVKREQDSRQCGLLTARDTLKARARTEALAQLRSDGSIEQKLDGILEVLLGQARKELAILEARV